jgi:hypothetical protein
MEKRVHVKPIRKWEAWSFYHTFKLRDLQHDNICKDSFAMNVWYLMQLALLQALSFDEATR